ncbi:MAG: flagellar type III secretion system pore protein FliP [Hyphomicrobiales bacterium]
MMTLKSTYKSDHSPLLVDETQNNKRFIKLCAYLASSTLVIILSCVLISIFAPTAFAQDISIGLGEGTGVTERALQIIALITILSIAPSILIMVTSFTRIVIVLSLLRTAIGIQQSPPNTVIISLAMFLTAFIMAPVFEKTYEDAIKPLIAEEIELNEAFTKASAPFHIFMRQHVREKDLTLFQDLSGKTRPETPEDISLQVLIPAFMISELRRAFEIGFLIFVPFVVIDMVIASVLMSMGMMMLPPVMISLPFKLIFFVLVDGWHMVAGSLVKSFGV